MESSVSFKTHHLRAGRAEYATTLEPELWVQRCELRATVSQQAGDDNIRGVSFVHLHRQWHSARWHVQEARSSAAAKASSDSERRRLRRMPRSTSLRPSAARCTHAKSAASDIFFNSPRISVLRTSCGAPDCRNMRSSSNE